MQAVQRREEELASKQQALAQQEAALAQQEAALVEEESRARRVQESQEEAAALLERERQLAHKERLLKEREQALADKEAELKVGIKEAHMVKLEVREVTFPTTARPGLPTTPRGSLRPIFRR